MQRRNLLIGMGSLTVGGAAAVGTGAFTSVTAERSVSVAVADDSEAFLSLSKISDSANSQDYVDASGNQISLVLDESDNGGSGFNANAETRIDDLLQVRNQGTQTVNIWVTLSGGSTFDDDTLYFYPGDATDTALNDGEGDDDGNDVLKLGMGENANIGAYVNLGDVSNTDENITATFHANVERGDGTSKQVSESGQVTGPVLRTDPVDGVSYMTATVGSGPITTITVELDDSVYDWPNNPDTHHMEAVIDVDNDGLSGYDADLRFGWAAPNNLGRDGSSNSGGYLKTNFGGSPTVLAEEINGFTATESNNRLTYTFEIDWQAVANDTNAPLSKVPSEFEIEEIFGTDGGGISSSGLSKSETIAPASGKLPTGL